MLVEMRVEASAIYIVHWFMSYWFATFGIFFNYTWNAIVTAPDKKKIMYKDCLLMLSGS